MKIISVVLGLLALLLAEVALAAGAIATSVVGVVNIQTGTAAAHPLRQGDSVKEGDTITTAANSSAVLRFDDGEITALTGNSRMQVTAYQYNPANNSGNVFLSLISGGMRAITGLIGSSSPKSVAYRAATATIGIRGTTVDIITDGGTVAVAVADGQVSFTFGTETVVLSKGEAARLLDGHISRGDTNSVFRSLPPDMQKLLTNITALQAAISMAVNNQTGRETFDSSGKPNSTPNSGGSGGGGNTTVSSH